MIRKVLLGQCSGDLSASIGPEIETQNDVAVVDRGHRQVVFYDDRRLYEFIGDTVGI